MPANDAPGPAVARWLSRTRARIAVLALGAAAACAVAATPRLPPSRRAADIERPPRVEGVYPSAGRLPANLLRMYIVFSAPMSVGESRMRLRLVDDSGRTVDRPFLALEEELWDPSGRRLTVLFDPGRIKRGLRANVEMGPPLVEGRRYRLIVEAGWRDARGRPLREPYVKTFDVLAARRSRPDPATWSIQPPRAGTQAPLVVRFEQPLDRALLFTAMSVEDERGDGARGVVEVAAGEREWRFTPDQPWAPGRHRLQVSPELEDPAGNSAARVFDAELSPTHRDASPVSTREFLVAPGGRSPS